MNSNSSVRGRPIDPATQLERKACLMDAAYNLLQEKTYRSISIREIAEQANMKSAMISYYFGDKEGLFVALLEKLAEEHFARFDGIFEEENPVLAFIQQALEYFSGNTAITRLIADEILFQDSPLSERFIELFPKRMALTLPYLIKAQQQKGLYRKDANPTWAAFSLMTLIIMPFIGASVRQKGWGISDRDVTGEVWAEHIYQLFTIGLNKKGIA